VAIVALFVTCLITANIIAVKLADLMGLILPAAIFIFPLSYITGDVLTEVYGYRRARQVIWLGFFCNLITVAAIWLGQVLPPSGMARGLMNGFWVTPLEFWLLLCWPISLVSLPTPLFWRK
jgi:uncharacterized integral membrane protein (TIGR00697 family)